MMYERKTKSFPIWNEKSDVKSKREYIYNFYIYMPSTATKATLVPPTEELDDEIILLSNALKQIVFDCVAVE